MVLSCTLSRNFWKGLRTCGAERRGEASVVSVAQRRMFSREARVPRAASTAASLQSTSCMHARAARTYQLHARTSCMHACQARRSRWRGRDVHHGGMVAQWHGGTAQRRARHLSRPRAAQGGAHKADRRLAAHLDLCHGRLILVLRSGHPYVLCACNEL